MSRARNILISSKGIPTRDPIADLMGQKLAAMSVPVVDITGTLPLSFTARAQQVLKNYRLYGTASGSGVETENLWDARSTSLTERQVAGSGARRLAFTITEPGFYTVKCFNDRSGYVYCRTYNTTTDNYSPYYPLSVPEESTDTPQTETLEVDSDVILIIYLRNTGTVDETIAQFNLSKLCAVSGSTAPDHYIPPGFQIPLTVTSGQNADNYPLYIGDTKLGAEEYVDYAEQKVYREVKIEGLSEPLRAIGEYKDTLDLSTGIVTRRIAKKTFDGNETFTSVGPPNSYYRYRISSSNIVISNNSLCSHFIQANINSSSNLIGQAVYYSSSGGSSINIRPSGLSTLSAFTTFLSEQYSANTPCEVYYVKSTATTEQITVPAGLTGIIDGYLIQDGTPTQSNPIYPTANGEKQANDTYTVTALVPTDPPSPFSAITAYESVNTLTSTETLGSVTVTGRISEIPEP